MNTLTLQSNSGEITINAPQYGYTSELHLAIVTHDMLKINGMIKYFDCGSSNDYRICSIQSWLLPTAQKAALNTFLRDPECGRGVNIIMTLDYRSGFYPFGPDLGDTGDFTVRVLGRKQGGALNAPFRHWEDAVDFVLVSTTGQPFIDAASAQGSVSIGDVAGLPMPQSGYKPASYCALQTGITRSGSPFSVDGHQATDCWTAKFDQMCNAGNAAALFSYLRTIRSGTIPVVVPDNYFVFGKDNGTAGTYATRLLGSEHTGDEIIIKCKHEAWDMFTIPLEFWLAEPHSETYEYADPFTVVGYGPEAFDENLFEVTGTSNYNIFELPILEE